MVSLPIREDGNSVFYLDIPGPTQTLSLEVHLASGEKPR
jgi:hypothetical protein